MLPGRTWVDIVMSTVVLTVAASSWLAAGHWGLVASVAFLCVLWAITDLISILRWYRGEACVPDELIVAGTPVCPDLPVQWFAMSLCFQTFALFAMACHWSLSAGMLVFFFNGGCVLMCNLCYYSGKLKDNLITIITPTTMLLVTAAMVLTAPPHQTDSSGADATHKLLTLLAVAACGAIFARCVLWVMEVKPRDLAGESKPLQSEV